MKLRFAILLLLACSAAAGADVRSRAAEFYAAGLEKPLLQLRTGALLIRTCTERLRRACSREQRELAADDRTIELLDALTLFPQRTAQDPASGITRSKDLAAKIAGTSSALLGEAGLYDRQLLARYGATLRVCPEGDPAPYRESLAELERLDLAGFQSLEGPALARAVEDVAREESAWAEKLRAMPPEDCVAARTLGDYLMQLLHSKLQPWSGEDKRVANQEPAFEFGAPPKPAAEPPAAAIAHAVAGNFVSVVATELQITAYPESEARIRALGDPR